MWGSEWWRRFYFCKLDCSAAARGDARPPASQLVEGGRPRPPLVRLLCTAELVAVQRTVKKTKWVSSCADQFVAPRLGFAQRFQRGKIGEGTRVADQCGHAAAVEVGERLENSGAFGLGSGKAQGIPRLRSRSPHPPDGRPIKRNADGDVEGEGDAEGEEFDQAGVRLRNGVAHGGRGHDVAGAGRR